MVPCNMAKKTSNNMVRRYDTNCLTLNLRKGPLFLLLFEMVFLRVRAYPLVSSILRSCNQRLFLKMSCLLRDTDTLHSLVTGPFSMFRYIAHSSGLDRNGDGVEQQRWNGVSDGYEHHANKFYSEKPLYGNAIKSFGRASSLCSSCSGMKTWFVPASIRFIRTSFGIYYNTLEAQTILHSLKGFVNSTLSIRKHLRSFTSDNKLCLSIKLQCSLIQC